MSPIGMLQDLVGSGDMPTSAALVHADDFFADAIAAGLMGIDFEVEGTDRVVKLSPGLLADAGMELVYEEKWPEEGFSDWIGLANSMKASDAEMVFGLTASPDETIQLVRAMQTVGYHPKAVYLSQGTQEEFQQAVGDAAEGVMIHSAWDPAVQWEGLLAGEKFTNQDFQAAFEEEYGRPADEDEAIPFALCQGMEQAVRAVGSTDNVKLQEWLASRTESDPVKTVLGDFYWDERGLPVGKPMLMTQWQGGELKFVYPVGDFPGTEDLVYPKPEW
jgi:branched-chain amino acid transport system substrate-binding protein